MNKIVLGAVFAMLVGGLVGIVMSKGGKPSGPRWTNIGSSNGIAFLINAKSIVRTGSRSEAWFKTVQTAPAAATEGSYEMALTAFDCTKKTSALQSLTLYRSNGTATAAASSKDEELKFAPVTPDSMGEIELQAACA